MSIYSRCLCLLCPVGTADLRILRDRSVDDHMMDHSRTVSWDPGIADSRALSVCYDCLCLMTLFRTVMYLAHLSYFVLLAGFVLYIRRVDNFRTMAADDAALAEVRAGITFGVKLYVPWDAPEAVVDISSEALEEHSGCHRTLPESWFRIVGEWTRTITMLRLSIWERCRNRQFPFRSYRR